MATSEPHTIELEVSGNELPMFRRLLKRVKLSQDGVNRIRIEIESTTPLLPETDAEPETTPDTAPETESEPETEPEPETVESTEKPEPEKPDPEEIQGPNDRYLEEFDPKDDNVPKPSELEEYVEIPLNKGTAKWKVCGLLYRTQGRLQLKQMRSMLENTEWEISNGALSGSLSKLRDAEIVDRKEPDTGTYGGTYQLTQLGRDYVESVVSHTEGYSLTPADNATGKSPSRELEA